jgi:Holliday junction resolvase RusA-like endonuclease
MSAGLFDDTLQFEVPLEPISVNHYWKSRIVSPKQGSMFISTYITKEALAYTDALAACAAGRRVVAKEYEVTIIVYQGPNSRGDVDNYSKCVLDSLVKCGAITSDAKVVSLTLMKQRDRDRPRTFIRIRPFQGFTGL